MSGPHRHHMISACVASAQSAMDAIVLAIDLLGTKATVEVGIFPDTRGGRTVTAEERDQMAHNLISEVRQRLGGLTGLYPAGPKTVVLGREIAQGVVQDAAQDAAQD